MFFCLHLTCFIGNYRLVLTADKALPLLSPRTSSRVIQYLSNWPRHTGLPVHSILLLIKSNQIQPFRLEQSTLHTLMRTALHLCMAVQFEPTSKRLTSSVCLPHFFMVSSIGGLIRRNASYAYTHLLFVLYSLCMH